MSVDELKIEKLRSKLEESGLPICETKAVLRERLREALGDDNPSVSDAQGGADGKIDDEDDKKSEESEDADSDDDDNDDEDESDVEDLKLMKLKKQLKRLGLLIKGDKKSPKRQLRAAVMTSDEDEEEEERPSRSRRSNQPTLSFKHVEDALETFSGDGHENIVKWITNIEEIAEICKWSDAQTVMYGRRLLRGSAKLFMTFECSAKTWRKMKKVLRNEFGKSVNRKEVHRRLAKRKKKDGRIVSSICV